MRITAIVEDRDISASVEGTNVGGIGVDTLTIKFQDDSWEGFEHYAAWFAISGKAEDCEKFHPEPVLFDYAEEVELTELPSFVAGVLRLTIDAWDGDGKSHHQLTERMRRGIRIDRHGAHSFEGEEASATLQKLVKSAEDADAATERSNVQVHSAILAEQERGAEFIENESSRQAAFTQSQDERSGAFNEFMDEADADITSAVASAETAASAATATADSIKSRAEAGEFNGAAFSIKYAATSVAGFPSTAKVGEFGIIVGADQSAEDYGKLYVRDASGWRFVVDMSVPGAAIKGDKGDKGDTGPMPSDADVARVIATQFVVVDSMPTDPVEGIVYMIRE